MLVKLDPGVRYDVGSDPLYKAIAPALELHQKDAVSKTFYGWRSDYQLALLFAADLDLLPRALNAAVASRPVQYVATEVASVHEEAKDDHQLG